MGLSLWAAPLLADCQKWVARLVSAQGQVQVQASEQREWMAANPEQRFCPGDKIRTLSQSRASLQLPNQTYISLDQTTTVVFYEVEEDEPSLIEVLTGALFARSRTPKPLNIRTPFINATIKGTEFMIAVGAGKSEVTVFEGEVVASNAAGQVTVTDGQSASAGMDEAPKTRLAIRPEDSVQWALYFPPLLDMASLERKADDPAIAEAARASMAGKVREALAALDRIPKERRDADYLAIRVSLLLSVGRVDEAEPLLAGHGREQAPAVIDALRSVIALARNRKSEALERADLALKTDPRSAVAWIARSYALQAAFDLEGALEAADRAAELSPGEALVEARRAELLASLDRWAEARRAAEHAAQLNPKQSRAHVVKGFAELRAGEIDAAEASFRTATGLNTGDPLARVGLGLTLIRRGDLTGGTADLELAANLDPGASLIRSYLGKAYYEQKRNAIAEKQFQLAEQFDPKDPTPWFYDAIKKQTENRPVEALHDLQKAIELNGNRAVYRSKLALDQDLASRSAALARIYNDLGFSPRALVEGWKSVNLDPTNFSAHRLLADSYAALPGQETARASELLQSQLLQPINSTPIQPHLGESRLLVPSFSGPAQLSFNEFNPAFSRNGFHLQTTGLVGNLGTYGDEAVHSGIWNNFSYSLGQFHYQTEGFRPNNQLDQNIYNAFAQMAVTPEISVQAEYRHRELEHGDLFFDGNLKSFDPNFRRKLRTDTARAGLHYAPNASSNIILSFIYFDSLVNNALTGGFFTTSQRGFLGEFQTLYQRELFDLAIGSGRQEISVGNFNYVTPRAAWDMDLTNAYLYSHVHFPTDFTWTFGLSLDSSDNQVVGGRTQINPKVGLLWDITPTTLLRIAAFRSFIRGTEVNSTIEPTQVAGFNQFFDGWTGTDAWRYGIGLDHRFSPDILAGFEASLRNLTQPIRQGPIGPEGQIDIYHLEEYLIRNYLNWAITDSFTASIEYRYEEFSPYRSTAYKNHIVPIAVNFFHPSGFSAGTTLTYVNQNGYGKSSPGFELLDVALRYRFPGRHGIASLIVKNLLDQDFDFVGPNTFYFRTGRLEETPMFLPQRTITLQLTFAF